MQGLPHRRRTHHAGEQVEAFTGRDEAIMITTPSKLPCPKCGRIMDFQKGTIVNSDGPSDEAEGPLPGTLIPCPGCMSVLVMDDNRQLEMAGVHEVRSMLADKNVADFIMRMVAMVKDNENDQRYYAHIGKMLMLFNAWKADNPSAALEILYRFPEEVAVIGTIGDAIKGEMVSVNAEARRAFTELGWMSNTSSDPTVLMVRCVTEMETIRSV